MRQRSHSHTPGRANYLADKRQQGSHAEVRLTERSPKDLDPKTTVYGLHTSIGVLSSSGLLQPYLVGRRTYHRRAALHTGSACLLVTLKFAGSASKMRWWGAATSILHPAPTTYLQTAIVLP
jgi:hypothetical protein